MLLKILKKKLVQPSPNIEILPLELEIFENLDATSEFNSITTILLD